MSTNFDQWSDDPRLTAFALGELEPGEAEEIARAVEADPELRRLVEDIRGSAALLEQAFEQEQAPALEEPQRARIVASARGPGRPSRRWLSVTIVGVGVAAAALVVVVPASVRRQPEVTAQAGATQQLKAAERPPQKALLSSRPPVAEPMVNADPTTGDVPVAAGETSEPVSAETYAPIQARGFAETSVQPRTTFSIDVDTASYSNVRRYLQGGQLPPANAVRIEEMINYFDYDLAPPQDGKPIAIHVDVTDAPWNSGHLMARVALKGKVVARGERPAAHLVFLIDVSGSMSAATRLPLVKESLKLLLEQLEPRDTIAIVTYAGGVGMALARTPVRDKPHIRQAIDRLVAGGATNGSGGIQVAYRVARDGFDPAAINRVILATDGDFNVGISDRRELERLIAAEASSGVFLTVLGFGMGNLNDATLETLADKGNGHYAYVDQLAEAKKVLVDEVSSTLVPIAKDVKVQLEFNPARVSAYRLVGYENRQLQNRDFGDDKKDAGDMGAGHAVTMLYELVPARGEGGEERLRYQGAPTDAAGSDELFFVRVRYKDPLASTSELLERPVKGASGHLRGGAEDLRFATAVAAFGLKLVGAPEVQGLRYQTIAEWVDGARRHDPLGRRAELASLIRRASELSDPVEARARTSAPSPQQLVAQIKAVKDPELRARLLALVVEAGPNHEALMRVEAEVREALRAQDGAARPSPRTALLVENDGLPAEAESLLTTIARHAEIEACRALAEEELTGVATVAFDVGGDGRATHVTVSPARFKGTRFEACVKVAIGRMSFKRLNRLPVPIAFPVTLRPKPTVE